MAISNSLVFANRKSDEVKEVALFWLFLQDAKQKTRMMSVNEDRVNARIRKVPVACDSN